MQVTQVICPRHLAPERSSQDQDVTLTLTMCSAWYSVFLRREVGMNHSWVSVEGAEYAADTLDSLYAAGEAGGGRCVHTFL